MQGKKEPVLFSNITPAHHLTPSTGCLTLSPRGEGQQEGEAVPSARPAVGQAESSLPAPALKYL